MHAQSRLVVATAVSYAVTGSYALPTQAMGKCHARWVFSGDYGSQSGNLGGTRGSSGHGGSRSSSSQGGGGSNKGAPGPISEAGLPFLLVAGGSALVRRYRSKVEQQ